MDWKVFTATFFTIFIAEMGDKTQLAAFSASASSKATYSVLLAVVLALALAGSLGVLAGNYLGNLIDPIWVKRISGLLFILMGIWVLLRKG